MVEKTMSQKLLKLVADERFSMIEDLANRPSLFRVVGRTHTETWHSMFLGWLLDPEGTHGLGDFPLRRLLLSLTSPDLQGTSSKNLDQLARIASLGDLSNATVVPNERDQKEFPCSVGRIDVFASGIACEGYPDCVLLLEQKVNAPINKNQCQKYANWLWTTYPHHLKILVMLAPEDRLGITPERTMGDSRWNAINYQTLHDVVLAPVLRAPKLNTQTEPLIAQYVEALRIPAGGRKLVVTEEEKELATQLYDAHRDAFEAIAAALSGEVDIDLSSRAAEKTPLRININGQTVTGKSVPEFYMCVLKYLEENAIDINGYLPFATGARRYLISTSPEHPGGNPFRAPVENGSYFLEAHKARIQAVKDVVRFLRKIGLTVTEK